MGAIEMARKLRLNRVHPPPGEGESGDDARSDPRRLPGGGLAVGGLAEPPSRRHDRGVSRTHRRRRRAGAPAPYFRVRRADARAHPIPQEPDREAAQFAPHRHRRHAQRGDRRRGRDRAAHPGVRHRDAGLSHGRAGLGPHHRPRPQDHGRAQRHASGPLSDPGSGRRPQPARRSGSWASAGSAPWSPSTATSSA